MDRVRSAFNSMIKSERYSRFTLQPADDGETHVEVKLSDGATEAGDQAGGSPSFRPAPPRYLLGYLCHHETREESVNCGTEPEGKMVTPPVVAPTPEVPLYQLLTQKLTSRAFDKTLRDFDLPRRSAGSVEDRSLANRIFDQFKKAEMEPWTDIHYVQLQMPDRCLQAYRGKLVYGNYGRQEDLDVLQKQNIELKDNVLLLRAGKISFAEQVDNAATKGASAVLIYPDVQDYKYVADTELYGHVHLGSGDPYTPGFPSFNHTQFPPTQSSGLPKIPAQTITAKMALALLNKIGGPEPDASSGFKGDLPSVAYSLGGSENITVEVNNVLVNQEIHNVFGVIKGFTDPDQYVVLGAQRDAWGEGFAKATVGTSILIELAKAVREMVENDGFRPRRSLVFASWSAGEYGSVGATEWLEGYMSSIGKRVFTYISLDGVVMGSGSFIASASPLLHSLLENTMREVKCPFGSGTVYDVVGASNWEAKTLRPMSMDDPAYPFLAFSGIPSISFHFISPNTEAYTYYGTILDNKEHLNYATSHRTSEMVASAAQFAGQMALRLVHDHLLSLDSGQLKGVNPNWLNRARGSFQRAAASIKTDIQNTDLNDKEACRILNDRIMSVEHSLLSPYVSPIETPFRHLLLGRGSHTLASIAETTDMGQLHIQLALATWNLQGCANAMEGNLWDIDEEI
ncbi:hypothetical protein FQN60_013520 [Etheostoma spectabile]|uniref:Transferrin receptor protein 1 n=1 Tax=Etheostoma spectabile TaxID=54343 RepID=A0A5J5CF65_9PERO|nr:hypothetical protein FQN60_013520 [Etheostoma spectabile]